MGKALNNFCLKFHLNLNRIDLSVFKLIFYDGFNLCSEFGPHGVAIFNSVYFFSF